MTDRMDFCRTCVVLADFTTNLHYFGGYSFGLDCDYEHIFLYCHFMAAEEMLLFFLGEGGGLKFILFSTKPLRYLYDSSIHPSIFYCL